MNSKMIIDLDSKNHTGFSLISYANDLADELKYSKKEKLKIIKDMFLSKNFDEVLDIFKHNFSSISIIYYRNKELK